jgi:hypothetical protein
MSKLLDKYYDAEVISDEIDPNHGGAVRVRILGVTDQLDDKDQPWVIPSVNSQQAVPTKGTKLRVAFDEGDINQGKYFQWSPEITYLPQEYIDDYPNVSVSNLGGDFFIMVHNRRTRDTIITHPSESSVTWDNFGTITHDSDRGYKNAGLGANDNNGTKIHPVLTEATIDVFCCTPIGHGINLQGSEYMKVTHVSKSTVNETEALGNLDFTGGTNVSDDSGENEGVTKDIFDIDGNAVNSVEYIQAKTIIERTEPDVKEDIDNIILSISGANDFIEIATRIKDETNNLSAHYLVGREAGPPPIDSERTASESEKAKGFLQFVELKNDATLGSNKLTSLLNVSNRANNNAVSILIISDGTSFTEYQYTTISQLIDHIKYTFDDNSIEIYTDGNFDNFDFNKVGISTPSTLTTVPV